MSGFFFHPTINSLILWTPIECPIIQFISDPNNSELAQIPQGLKLSPIVLSTSDASCKSQISTCTSDQWAINSCSSHNPLSGFIICDKGLQNSEKLLLTMIIACYYKGYNSGIAKWKKYIGQGMREKKKNFHASSRCANHQTPQCVYHCGRSSNPIIQGFYGSSIIIGCR